MSKKVSTFIIPNSNNYGIILLSFLKIDFTQRIR